MKSYYPTINLLRGIAALLVCLFHFAGYSDVRGSLFPAGTIIPSLGKFGVNGVYVFFVISGFVIPLALYKDRFKLNQLHHFLSRRFIRIEIPYLISILLIILTGFLFALKNNEAYPFSMERFIYHIIYCIPFSGYEWYNVIYWTLAIEFQFYIVIGLLYYFLSHENKLMVYLALIIFGASGFLVTDDRFVFHYATIFLQGIILFMIKSEKLDAMIGFLLMICCVVATAFCHSFEIAAFTALTVMAIQFLEINNTFSNRFGEISYSLYLTHGLIGGNLLYFFARLTTGVTGKVLLMTGALILSFLFAWLFWRLIENPSRKLSRKIKII